MEKKVITLDELRVAISDVLNDEIGEDVKKMSDDSLLESNMLEDLIMDSLDIIESVMILEKNHGISIPDNSYENFRKNGCTVRALLNEINRVIGQ